MSEHPIDHRGERALSLVWTADGFRAQVAGVGGPGHAAAVLALGLGWFALLGGSMLAEVVLTARTGAHVPLFLCATMCTPMIRLPLLLLPRTVSLRLCVEGGQLSVWDGWRWRRCALVEVARVTAWERALTIALSTGERWTLRAHSGTAEAELHWLADRVRSAASEARRVASELAVEAEAARAALDPIRSAQHRAGREA
jgi:hypothetical protein